MAEEKSNRHSSAFEVELVTDEDARAAQEARNGLRQIDAVAEMVETYVERGSFKLRPSALLHLHRMALEGISSYAGVFRPAGIEIGGSKHIPPGAHRVPELIEDLCEYVNGVWQEQSALRLAAYTLWRLNWIHPFTDGNGRTARATSYLVLCLRIGHPLYGANSVPAQISNDKQPYYKALEAADEADRNGMLDVSELENLISEHLARQLLGVFKGAGGDIPKQ
ncbi:MAG: Fic family protein [Acidobacteriota bacterium]